MTPFGMQRNASHSIKRAAYLTNAEAGERSLEWRVLRPRSFDTLAA